MRNILKSVPLIYPLRHCTFLQVPSANSSETAALAELRISNRNISVTSPNLSATREPLAAARGERSQPLHEENPCSGAQSPTAERALNFPALQCSATWSSTPISLHLNWPIWRQRDASLPHFHSRQVTV